MRDTERAAQNDGRSQRSRRPSRRIRAVEFTPVLLRQRDTPAIFNNPTAAELYGNLIQPAESCA